jgi:hypothetical protein
MPLKYYDLVFDFLNKKKQAQNYEEFIFDNEFNFKNNNSFVEENNFFDFKMSDEQKHKDDISSFKKKTTFNFNKASFQSKYNEFDLEQLTKDELIQSLIDIQKDVLNGYLPYTFDMLTHDPAKYAKKNLNYFILKKKFLKRLNKKNKSKIQFFFQVYKKFGIYPLKIFVLM